MYFPEDYFKDEVRDGFLIKAMVKRAWAAQIEIVEDMKKVCDEHGIRFFVDYGTLLGAVRHKGFIPWDDDIDLCMIRTDYERFLEIAEKEMPSNYSIYNYKTDPNTCDSLVARVVNSRSISFDSEKLEKYHGFPYVAGVDIFILDYISPNPEEDEVVRTIINLAMSNAAIIDEPEYDEESKQYLLDTIENLSGITLDKQGFLRPQLLELVDNLSKLYREEEANEITSMVKYTYNNKYHMDKSVYADTVYLPFENIMVPAPVGYETVLLLKYGPDYMTPVNKKAGHDYPFYKDQEELFFKHYGYRPE